MDLTLNIRQHGRGVGAQVNTTEGEGTEPSLFLPCPPERGVDGRCVKEGGVADADGEDGGPQRGSHSTVGDIGH